MRKSVGFTLVETLIAGVILFSVISLSALALKTARMSSASAERTIQLRTPLPMLTSHIRESLQANAAETVEGEGMLSGVQFQWVAQTIAFASAPPEFDVDLGVPVVHAPRHRLYEVSLTLTFAGKSEVFTYKEFASERQR